MHDFGTKCLSNFFFFLIYNNNTTEAEHYQTEKFCFDFISYVLENEKTLTKRTMTDAITNESI